MISGLTVGLGVASLFGCVICGVGAAGLSTYTAYDTCTSGASGGQCALAVGSAAVSWTGLGASGAGAGFSSVSRSASAGATARLSASRIHFIQRGVTGPILQDVAGVTGRWGANLTATGDVLSVSGLVYDTGSFAHELAS